MRDGSRALASAVIQQALADAPMASTAKSPDRRTARSFLFSGRREWAEARRFWFELAGFREPSMDVLRAAVDVVHAKDARRGERAATRRGAALARQGRDVSTQQEAGAA